MVSFGTVKAQDLITTRDGKDIHAKIIEVTPDEIKYKKFDNQDGPLFTMRKADVLIIRYQNGENEVFANETSSAKNNRQSQFNTTAHITDRMVFSQYRYYYDPNLYQPESTDPFTPTGCGLASFFIPGLGQGLAGEWGRGFAFFGAHLVLGFAGFGLPILLEYDDDGTLLILSMILGGAGMLIVDIWSIVDAVKVAKIKNMYFQDLRHLQAGVGMSVSPYLTFAPEASGSSLGLTPVAGLSFNLSF